MAFGNLTIDFRQLSKIPVRDRVTLAQSPQASSIFGNLSPIEIAALFPDYYKKFIPTGGGSGGGASMVSGMTGAAYTGSGGGATPAPTRPTTPAVIQEILDSAGPMPDRYGGGSTNGQVEVLKFARRWGISPQAAAGVLRIESGIRTDIQGGAGNNFYGVFQLQGQQIPGLTEKAGFGRLNPEQYRKLSLGDQLKVMDEYYKQWNVQPGFFTGDPSKDAAKMWALQLAPGNAKKINYDDSNAVISKTQQASKIMSSGGYVSVGSAGAGSIPGGEEYLKDAEQQGLPGTAPIDQALPADETGIIPLEQGGTATVVPQTQAFDPAIFSQLDPRIHEYYKTASDTEKKQIEHAITKLGVNNVQQITSKHPTSTATAVTDKLYQESVKNFTDASSAAGFYDNIRSQYPDKIDLNSPIWNTVDPELAKAKKSIVDADTGLVGRDALLAADSAAKVLRNNNYIPRIASGGDNHSANHGSGRDANYSIDLAASVVDKNGKVVPIELGKDMPEKIKNDMATAAYFASMDAVGGHRVGYPDSSSPHSMHIQQDPARRTAYWGYSETAKRLGVGTSSVATLQATEEGKRFLAERETINRLTPEQKAEYFDNITGYKTQKLESQSANIVQTQPAATEPISQTPNVKPETSSDVNITPLEKQTSISGTEATTQAQPIQQETTAAPLQQAEKNMALGGTKSTDVEPNMVNEKYTIAQTDPKTGETKPIANFNKDEEVNIKDGQMNVDSAYKKKAEETLQKTDTGMPNNTQNQNQYAMRQTSDRPKDALAEQVKYGFVPRSPSYERSVTNSKFGISHFNIGAKSQYS